MGFIFLKFYTHVDNIHMQETFPQICYLGLSFNFMLNREDLVEFFNQNFLYYNFDKTKTKT